MKRSKKLRLKTSVRNVLVVVLIMIIFISFGISKLKDSKKFEAHEIVEEDNYTLKIDYPRVENKDLEQKILTYIGNQKEAFLKTVYELEDVTETKSDLSITYTEDSWLDCRAVHINVYYYTGGAHYNKETKSYYFNTKNGKLVDITYFLEEDGFKKLANLAYYYVVKYYKENDLVYDEEWIKEGTSSKLENYSYFSIDEKGLNILFTYYQVGPHCDGEKSITIPLKELKGIVKEKYLTTEEQVIEVVKREKRDLSKFEGKKLLAFTFDDGPSDVPTNKLLDNLDKYDARVSFFVLGSRVNTYKDTLKRAYEMGNTIASHTYSHLNLYQLSDYDVIGEINRTNDAIESIIGVKPEFLRVPYGNTNAHIKELGNMITVLWDVDTEDWRYKNANTVKDNIIKHAHDGAIILLHDIYTTSVEGAVLAMEELKDEYAFVSIEEMIELKKINLDKTKTYFNF